MTAFRSIIVFFLFVFLSWEAAAGIVPYTRGLLKTPDDLSSQVLVNDPSGSFTSAIVPVWTGLSHIDRSKKGVVTLGVNHHFQYWGEYTVEAKIKLTTYTTLAGTGVIDTITLKISCFPGDSLSYLDKQSYTFNNVEKFDVMLLDVKLDGVSQSHLVENIFIQGDIYVDRVYDFTGQLTTGINITSTEEDAPLDLDCDSIPDEYVISWDPVEGAEEYQLEWVYINDYDKSIGDLSVDFRINSTRITTSGTNYHLSLVFDKGYICYRVRAVGRSMTDVSRFIFTPWSTTDGDIGVSSCNYYQQTTPYDALKNWQYSSTYAEEGKKKEVVSFFDGSLRNRQMVTKINSDKNTIVGETIYDHQGRPAIQVLPVPVSPTLCNAPDSTNSLKFYENFNRKDSVNAYTKLDFDTSSVLDSCSTILGGMHVSSGASNYYSGSNPNNTGIQGYLPDAENFPFSQVEYTPDNTGRISRQGGVGPDFQLGSGHETKYFYGHPFQEQLDRLFGSEVGDYSHYQKNMVIDPNGQVSISYLDQEGRVIATSLAGEGPDNLIALESAGEAGPLTVDLFSPSLQGESSSNVLGIDGRSKVFNQSILLSSKTTLEIHYDLNVTPFVDTCMSVDSSVCFNCIYDLQIEVRDMCGALVSPRAISDKLTGRFELDSLDRVIFKTDCANLAFDTTFVVDSLPVGSYQITKILTVNEAAIEAYVAMHVNDSLNLCKPGYDELLEEQQSLIDNECEEDFSCQECIENLGTLIDYLSAGGTEDDYNLEVAACNGPCTPVSYYETMRNLLKGDVMPSGQYAQYSNASGIQVGMYPLSVLNTGNLLPKNPDANWKHPKYDIENSMLDHYYDEDGITISRIYLEDVVINGSNVVTASTPQIETGLTIGSEVFLDPATGLYYTYPENLLKVADFISYYGSNMYWANSLVYYHPEYPILKYYRTHTRPITPGDRFTTEAFDAAMMEVNTWDDAVTAGFIKSTYASEAINNRLEDFMTDSTHTVWDPFTYYDPLDRLEQKVASYITINGINYSMMQFAGILTRCTNLSLGTYPGTACTLWGDDVGIDPTQNELKRNEAWMAFRSLYFSEKQKIQQTIALDLSLTDADYYGYNACIGNVNFNHFANGFRTFGFAPGPIFTAGGQYYNTGQPCATGRWLLYQNKEVRFGTPVKLSNMTPQQVAYQTYLVTSQCPNAAALQSVLNEVAGAEKLDDNSFSLNSLNSFAGLLLALNNFDISTTNQNINWVQTTMNPATLEVLWNDVGASGFATLQLVKDPMDTLGYTWSQVIGFSNLYFTEVNNGIYEFTAFATVQMGVEVFLVPITGTTTLPIGNCEFEDVCEKNDLANDLQQLLQAVTEGTLLDDATPVNISTVAAFDSFITDNITDAVSLSTPGNLSWVFDSGIPAFKITNAANSDYLRLGINAFSPSTFSVANMNLIAGIEELVVGPNNTFELICSDASGNYLVTIKCDAVRVTSGGLQAIELGDCGLPTPLLCDSEPYQNLEDLEALLSDVLINQDAPLDLYNSMELSSSLETQINAPLDQAIGTVSSLGVGKKKLTFNLPTDCDLTLNYDSIPGLNFSFDSIISVEELAVSGETNTFGSYNSFELTVNASIGGIIHEVVLDGFSCLNLKECVSCEIEAPGCSFSTVQLDSIDSVLISTNVLVPNNSFDEYQYYCDLIDTFNVHHGLTPLDPDYLNKLNYHGFFTQLATVNSGGYYTYMNEFVDSIDTAYWLQNPGVFYNIHRFNSVQLQYERYLDAVNFYNAHRDGVILDHIAPVTLMDFVTTIYSENCTNYINYLLGHISDPGVTQTVLEYPYDWLALYYPTDCLTNYLEYAQAYQDHLGANPSCATQALGEGQMLSYGVFQTRGLCNSSCGLDTLAYFINQLETTSSCNFILPVIGFGCPSYETDTAFCNTAFIEYTDWVDSFNISPWALANNITLTYEFLSGMEMYEAGVCRCAKLYAGGHLIEYINAADTANLPPPMTLTEFCGRNIPEIDPECADAYQQYLSCVALYNSNAMANESEDLIDYVISERFFASESLCNCVDAYCAELSLVSDSLKNFDQMPNILTFCGCDLQPACPNDSMNINAEPFIVEFADPCEEFYEANTSNTAYIAYEAQTQNMQTDISSRYIQHCLGALENMSVTYNEIEHHFTLYYYDQAGNLIKTVPPEGVEIVDVSNPGIKQAILEDRANNTHQVITSHRMQTTYLYNSLNQLVAQNMPDQDEMQVFEVTLPNGLPTKLMTTAIQMVNSNQGYLTGYITNSNAPMGSRGYLFATTNGGQNWTRVTNTIASDLKRVRMIDASDGFALGTSGVLLLTQDGGATWDLVDTYSSDIQEDFVSLEVSTTQAFALTKSGKIFKCTTAGVISSHAVTPANGSYTVNEFKDFSLQNNYSTTTGILYIASLNDGTSDFDAVLLNNGSSAYTLEKVLAADLDALSFYSSAEGITAGTDGNLSLLAGTNSSDFLQTMKVSGTVAPIDQLQMLNAQLGLARMEENGVKVIRKTTDGGASWLPLNEEYTDANLALINRSGTSNMEVLVQGYANGSAYSKTIFLASSGVITELNQTPVAAQNIDLKAVYAFRNGANTTVFGIGANDSLYRSNTFSLPGTTLIFTGVPGAGTIPSDPKQVIVVKDGAGVSVNVLLTSGTLKQSTCSTLTGTYTAFTSVSGAASLVWMDKITLSSVEYLLGYNSSDTKIYGKTASAGSLSAFTTSPTLGTSVITKIAVHGTQLTLVGTNGGIFTTASISSVPATLSFTARQDHRFPSLNTIEKLASAILITGENGLLITRAVSTSTSTGSVKPLNTLSDLYAASEFTNSSVTYYLVGGSDSYFAQFHSSTFAKTALHTTSGLTVTDHANGVTIYDIAVNNQGVYVVGGNGSAYYSPGITTDLFIPIVQSANPDLRSVCFNGTTKAITVGDAATLIRYNQYVGTINNRIFSPKYRDVHFADAQFGTVIGDHFFVRTTEDGGLSWTIDLPGTALTLSSSNIHDLRKVWTKTAANNTHFALVAGLDYMTTISNGIFTGTSFTGNISDIQFSAGSPTGYVSYNSALKELTLTPSGNSYTLSVSSSSIATSTDSIHAIHIFENQSVAYVGGSGKINYYNKGTNTSYTLATVSGATFRDVYFHDNVVGYAVGDAGKWYHLTSNNNDNVTHDILSGALSTSLQAITDPEIGTDTDYNITALAFNSRTTSVYGGYYTDPVYVSGKKAMVRNLHHEGGMFTARFYYDRLGRIVTSQNSRQLLEDKFSYTLYDELGRVYEAGEKSENPDSLQFASIFGTNVGGMTIPGVIDDTRLASWLNYEANTTRKEVTRSYYDVTNASIALALPVALNEATQRKRIVHVTYETTYDGIDSVYDHATHYEYDIHGNVKTLLQENRLLGAMANLDHHRFKRMDYTYDLISGNVHRVDYETGNADQWHHAYNYDADNRITDVYTSKETPLLDIHSSVASLQNEPEINPLWDQEASYEYYAHGPLARTTLGDQEVQGIDYVYTLQGWIKGVNSNGLNQDKDPGRDGNGVSEHKEVARDVFGYSLHYFAGDYSPIVGGNSSFVGNQNSSDLAANSSDLYNGNIGRMVTTITDPNTREVLPLGNAYQYDQLNRLKQAKSFDNLDLGTNTWGSGGTTMYYNAFDYDANGNIEKQVRKNHAGTTIDSLAYKYHDLGGERLRNRLYAVNDGVSGGTFADDIDNMSFDANQATIANNNNYVYDAEGRLIHDEQENIDSIIWRVDGKVKSIIRPASSSKKNVSFDYDAMGHRIAKHVLTSEGLLKKSTYYILDAQGNTMSVYERMIDSEEESITFAQTEKHIYGSGRLGMHNEPVPMLGSQNDTYSMETVNHRIGERTYELSNHLGNVLSVVSDKLMPSSEEYDTVVDFYDRFDIDGDFLGWVGWADTSFVDNGTYTAITYSQYTKYLSLINTPIPYYNGTWYTNYTLSCDILYLSAGGEVKMGPEGGTPQSYYTTGTQSFNISYPNVTGGFEFYTVGDSVVLDNIKLIHDLPPYLYNIADIRQSTDYSPFGVVLEQRNLGQPCQDTTEVLVEEAVEYTDFGISVNGDGDLELNERAPVNITNGASGVQMVNDGEYIEFEVPAMPQTSIYYCVGLSYQETDYQIESIDYGWYLYYTGQLYVWENGVDNTTSDDATYSMGSQTTGDIYRIYRDSGTIRYYKNGSLVRSVADGNQSASMVVDVSIIRLSSETSCKVQDLEVAKWSGGILVPEPVQYKGLSCAKVETDGDLYIDTTNLVSWRNGASGVQSVNENEYIEFEIENTSFSNNNYVVGLSPSNTTHAFGDADYAWYMDNNGNAFVYENASLAYSAGSYAIGDKFRITRSGGYIRYSKNGVALDSTVDPSPSTSLLIDLALHRNSYNPYCAIHNLRVAKLQPSPNCSGGASNMMSGLYRYGYQGSERDDEVKGSGNSYTTEFRQLDPRLGRWLTLDPVVQPWQSPYCSMDNNPIWYNDVLGTYSEKTADRKVRRAEKHGYQAKKVENRSKKDDFGVYYQKERKEGIYFKTQYEGRFSGIGKAGLKWGWHTTPTIEVEDPVNIGNFVDAIDNGYGAYQNSFDFVTYKTTKGLTKNIFKPNGEVRSAQASLQLGLNRNIQLKGLGLNVLNTGFAYADIYNQYSTTGTVNPVDVAGVTAGTVGTAANGMTYLGWGGAGVARVGSFFSGVGTVIGVGQLFYTTSDGLARHFKSFEIESKVNRNPFEAEWNRNMVGVDDYQFYSGY